MSTENDVAYLKQIPVFHRLDDAHLKFVFDTSTTISLGADEAVFEKGGVADALYLVVQGTVGLYEPISKKDEVLIQVVESRDVLGWSWMVSPFQWHFSARTHDPAILMKFDAAQLRARCLKEPAFGYGVMQRISEQMMARLHAVRNQMARRINQLERELEQANDR